MNMGLIQDQPEGLPSGNDLDDIEERAGDLPQETGERAEIYLSGAHIATLDNAPNNRERITMLVELEVTEVSVKANGDVDVPIRKMKRVGDMYLPGTKRPPTAEEIKAEQLAAKVRAATEKAAQEEAERAEQEKNEPPMFTEDGDPIDPDGDEEPAPALSVVGPAFSDGAT